MEIWQIVTGYLEENCYILVKDEKCLIVDPGDDVLKIQERIKNLEVLAILVTHHHFDHVGALKPLLKLYDVPVYDFSRIQEKDCVVGPFSFYIIYNPGHSKDSVSFYFEKENVMFVGDFIFKGTIGRCDLEGGNFLEMKESLNKIKSYSNLTILYPGHGESTTLENEKNTNIYFTN